MNENAATPPPLALAAEALVFRRGARSVLNRLDLALAPGERLAISGPSGCGKTTLLRALAGLETADSGRVRIGGLLASDGARTLLPPWQRGLQFVFQDLGLWPTRSVLQNVGDVLRWNRAPYPKARARELLARVGLAELADRAPATLSGGEAHRLAFARALAARPKILLLDEPFTSLDPEARDEGFALLEDALRETGAAVILVSHDPSETERLGGRRMHMEGGQLKG
ncbi:MAG: ATP-binding cassette domain-containing protein [Planctomycetota bacterium]|nr:ATP-binding cassette domain-containing protein [Planctomycetota bacterium]